MARGLDNVLRKLNRQIKDIEGATLAGVRSAALIVQAEAMERTPVKTSRLLGGAFSDAEMKGRRAVGRVGYDAKYAPFVHEMPATNNFTKIGTGPKFLERAVIESAGDIVKVIQDKAKIK